MHTAKPSPRRLGAAILSATLALVTALPAFADDPYGAEASMGVSAHYYGWWGHTWVSVDCGHPPAEGPAPCGPGPRSVVNSGYGDVSAMSASGTPTQGALAGQFAVWRAGHSPDGFDLRGNGGASADLLWTDTFTINSGSLAFGTPVTVTVSVALTVAQLFSSPDLGACSIGGHGGCAGARAIFHWGAGYDAPWLAYAEARTPRMGEEPGPDGWVVSPHNPDTVSFASYVGQSFVLSGDLRLGGGVDVDWDQSFTAGGAASALFTVDVSTEGAGYLTASGADYRAAAAVPEPAGWAMLGLGLALVAGARRRR
jgi:hypothetical protein